MGSDGSNELWVTSFVLPGGRCITNLNQLSNATEGVFASRSLSLAVAIESTHSSSHTYLFSNEL